MNAVLGETTPRFEHFEVLVGFAFVGIAEWLMEVASVKLQELTKFGKAKKTGRKE